MFVYVYVCMYMYIYIYIYIFIYIWFGLERNNASDFNDAGAERTNMKIVHETYQKLLYNKNDCLGPGLRMAIHETMNHQMSFVRKWWLVCICTSYVCVCVWQKQEKLTGTNRRKKKRKDDPTERKPHGKKTPRKENPTERKHPRKENTHGKKTPTFVQQCPLNIHDLVIMLLWMSLCHCPF